MIAALSRVSVDSAALRRTFSCFPTGVAVLSTLVDGAPVGLVVSTFTGVSLEPPLVSVCLQRSSATWQLLRVAPALGVSVLSAEQYRVGKLLAGRGADRFSNVGWESDANGAVFVSGASAWLRCRISEELEGGDHIIALLTVAGVHGEPDCEPLVFHASRFRRCSDISDGAYR